MDSTSPTRQTDVRLGWPGRIPTNGYPAPWTTSLAGTHSDQWLSCAAVDYFAGWQWEASPARPSLGSGGGVLVANRLLPQGPRHAVPVDGGMTVLCGEEVVSWTCSDRPAADTACHHGPPAHAGLSLGCLFRSASAQLKPSPDSPTLGLSALISRWISSMGDHAPRSKFVSTTTSRSSAG